jgi:hypothetical protein
MPRELEMSVRCGSHALHERTGEALHVAMAAHGRKLRLAWFKAEPTGRGTIWPSRQRSTFLVEGAISPFRFSIGLVVRNALSKNA